MENHGSRSLEGKVCVVTGASRGVGRGIAEELGIAGATVYVTGRSRRGAENPEGIAGTIEETAQLVTDSGGHGIPVFCDHTDEAAVTALAEQVRDEQGRVDILVNSAWGGYENYDESLFSAHPSEQPMWRWDKMMTTGVRAQFMTTKLLLLLLAKSERGLIINISAGDEQKFLGDVQYDVAKHAVSRLAFALNERLKDETTTALTLLPGMTITERVVHVTGTADIPNSHSARFVGRCVVAIATADDLQELAGGAHKTGDIGRRYDLRDVDNSKPEPFVI